MSIVTPTHLFATGFIVAIFLVVFASAVILILKYNKTKATKNGPTGRSSDSGDAVQPPERPRKGAV